MAIESQLQMLGQDQEAPGGCFTHENMANILPIIYGTWPKIKFSWVKYEVPICFATWFTY